MNQPNILYFVCHDIGKHLSCYGVPVETPRLEAFAGQAVQFNNTFCNSPACSPSRACAMTGRYAHTTEAIGLSHMGWPLHARQMTIVDYLNAAGYETILSGVNHERHPNSDRYAMDLTRHWADWNADRAVANAVAYLETRDRSRPFYLNIGTQQPHSSSWGDGRKYGGPVPPEQVWIPPYIPDNRATRAGLGLFQAAVRFMDTQFGLLLDALDQLGYAQNTVVVFTTDHGISAARSKGTLYDRGVEIALLVRMPGGQGAGRQVTHLIQNIDFMPTFCEAAGVPVPGDVQGRSFWPLLTGGEYRPHDALYTERNYHGERPARGADGFVDQYDPVRAVRTPEFHYLRWFKPEVKPRPLLPWEFPAGWQPESLDYELGWPVSTAPRVAEE